MTIKKHIWKYLIVLIVLLSSNYLHSASRSIIIVAQDGSGDFKNITDAVTSLPMFNYERITILIKNGLYNEKIRIEQNNITLKGQDKEKTIIQFNQLRTDWIENKDSIGPAVINIHADDIVFENLTIKNTQPEIGPHAFAIYGTGTRTIIINCNVISKGGDTVSLWDYKSGMYYHANCYFEGAVDFVCPRGWCFIKNSKFYEVKQTAALWHAGGSNINQKFVIENSSFDGVDGFSIGRHHYEAQFYLINCQFSKNMADKNFYRVTYPDSTKNRPFNWGTRYYFYNCQRDGGNYDWFKNNLDAAFSSPSPDAITPSWTFDNMWDPESIHGPKVLKYTFENNKLTLFFNESITVISEPNITTVTGKILKYSSGAGSNTIAFISDMNLSQNDIAGLKLSSGKMIGTIASVNERPVDFSVN